MTNRRYPELLTLTEVAEMLRCHPNTLRKWDAQGLLPAIKIGTKGTRRYRSQDVERLLQGLDESGASDTVSVVDLFSGCGGLSHGFSKAGFRVLLGVDNWALSLETFSRNHPGAKILAADLGNLEPTVIAESTGVTPGMVDVVVGGPPCQGFSISGKRNPEDPRNALYQSFVKFVAHYRPRAFLLENVPNLLSMAGGLYKRQIIQEFEALGYSVSYAKLLASDYGVPQNRRRVMFVGILGGPQFVFPMPTHGEDRALLPRVSCWDAISDLPEHDVQDGTAYSEGARSKYQLVMRQGSAGVYNHETIKHSEKTKEIVALVPDGGNYKDLPRELQNTRRVNIAWTRFYSKKPSHTIDTGHNHHFHYEYNRVPTARESARLQSFQDNFIFCGKKNEQIKQVGNAVPPLLAEVVARALGAHIAQQFNSNKV